MYKNLRISNIFCTFAAAKVKLIYNMLFESQIHDLKMWLPWCRIRRDQAALRAIVEQQRRMMKPEDVTSQSAQVISQIEKMTAFREAKTVMLYYPVHNEVDLRPLLDKYAGEKTFLLPVTHRHSMEVRPYDGEDMMRKGHLGVPEPVGVEDITIASLRNTRPRNRSVSAIPSNCASAISRTCIPIVAWTEWLLLCRPLDSRLAILDAFQLSVTLGREFSFALAVVVDHAV